MTQLELAVRNGNLDEMKELLSEDPSLLRQCCEEGMQLCFLAAKLGNLEIVKYIAEYSMINMEVVDDQNRNMLHYASMSGNVELCRYLAERVGLSVTGGDSRLITPYDIAKEGGHQELYAFYREKAGADLEEMYRNPIRSGMFPDPSILRVGEDYYMVNSTFVFFPCIPVSHSRDLIHWEIIGHAITNPDWAHLDGLEGGRGYWAPDISYDNGTYYIVATLRLNDTKGVRRRQMLVTAKQPQGPYSKPVFIEEDGIDPSLFHENGKHYMLLNRGARIFEISETGEKLSEPKLLYYGHNKHASEGPHILHKDGYYYLFQAEGGTGMGHRISVSRSKELMGVYEPCPYNPILHQWDLGAWIQKAGHGKPVCTQNGEWYIVYLCGRNLDKKYGILGRETALDPITWTGDGWPIINGLKGPSTLQIKPKLPAFTGEQTLNEARYDFGEGRISPEWLTPREPHRDALEFKGDSLYLKSSGYPLSDVKARNLLLRRQTDFCYEAEVELVLSPMEEGDELGLTCYYDENTWLTFGPKKTGDGWELILREHIGDREVVQSGGILLTGEQMKEKAEMSVLLKAHIAELKGCFCAESAGASSPELTAEDLSYLSSEGFNKGKRFTGATVGLYAYGIKEGFRGQFRRFVYQGLDSRFTNI